MPFGNNISNFSQEATIYVNEYYDSIDKRGSVTIFMQGALQSVYYDNDTNEVLDVNCKYAIS